MNANDLDSIQARLAPGERILWSSCPRQGVRFSISGGWLLVIAPITLLLLTLAAIFLIVAMAHGEPAGFFFTIFFWFILNAVVIGRLIDAWRRRDTVYALSDKQAIVVEGIVKRRVRAVPIKMIVELHWKESGHRIGTIACVSPLDAWHRKNNRREIKPVPLFRMIVDPRHVLDLLVEARKSNLPLTVTKRP
jgi:hypothetical protein